jgi:hypothetical protein
MRVNTRLDGKSEIPSPKQLDDRRRTKLCNCAYRGTQIQVPTPFSLYIRCYWPKEEVINATWTPPAVVKVK